MSTPADGRKTNKGRPRGFFQLKKLRLLDYLKKQPGGVCFDCQDDLAAVINVAPRQARRYVQALVAEGKIVVEHVNYKLGPSTWANSRTITVLKENN